MRWVTRRQIRVNRTATAWLVRRFIGPEAIFLFFEPEAVVRAHCNLEAVRSLYCGAYRGAGRRPDAPGRLVEFLA